MSRRRLTIIETITATLLSIMAIVISYYQYKVASDQTKLIAEQTKLMKLQTDNAIIQTEINNKQKALMEKQTKVAAQELKNAESIERMRKIGEWQELKKAIEDVFFNIYPHSGFEGLRKLPKEERHKWLLSLQEKLESQSKNPIILQNSYYLYEWRKAIETTRLAVRTFNPNETIYVGTEQSPDNKAYIKLITFHPKDPDKAMEDLFVGYGKGIHQHVVTVWKSAIRDSDRELLQKNREFHRQANTGTTSGDSGLR